MSRNPIRFFNRLTGQMETEQVYGERFLRWVYETGLGRLTLAALVKRVVFSRWYGKRMDLPGSRARIQPFVDQYGLDPLEFERPLGEYSSFNEFFYRRLRSGARPLEGSPETLLLPADGRHLLVPDVSEATDFWIKGQRFDWHALLGEPELAERLRGGSALISRLCPVDYHRFHFPCSGLTHAPVKIPGWLYSVSPMALRQRASILWENVRYRTVVESEHFGLVVFLEIGATCVGSIVHTAIPEAHVRRGDEKGYFRFGGSSVVTLVESGRVRWAEDLVEHGTHGVEVYAKMGQRAGEASA